MTKIVYIVLLSIFSLSNVFAGTHEHKEHKKHDKEHHEEHKEEHHENKKK